MRKLMIGLAVFSLVLGMASSVMAETKMYEFIFEYEGMYKYSDVTSKADGETNYYVRQTFSGRPTGEDPRTRYYSYYNNARVSKTLNLSCDDLERHFEAYTIASPQTGTGYQLYGQNVTGLGSTHFHIVGKWTP